MRRFDNYTIRTATTEETPQGFYNPPQMMDFTANRQQRSVMISAGESDSVDVYREGDRLLVMSSNRQLGYIGLQAFTLSGEEAGDFFEQSPDDNEDFRGWEDRSAPHLIRVMSNYLPY